MLYLKNKRTNQFKHQIQFILFPFTEMRLCESLLIFSFDNFLFIRNEVFSKILCSFMLSNSTCNEFFCSLSCIKSGLVVRTLIFTCSVLAKKANIGAYCIHNPNSLFIKYRYHELFLYFFQKQCTVVCHQIPLCWRIVPSNALQ